jgi:RNA polymerase sigma-70 factor (ECF subfamily)
MTEANDQILVRQCQDGDRRAFEILVDKYQKPLFNLALRMTRNYNDAEDIAQVTFLKAYENLASFDQKYKFFSWLYRIAVNESLNHVNQRKHAEELSDDMPADGQSPEEQYDQDETSRRIQDALMQLKEEYRAVIVLKHLQGFSYDQISDILEIPETKVKSRLFTARLILKDVLNAKGVGYHD